MHFKKKRLQTKSLVKAKFKKRWMRRHAKWIKAAWRVQKRKSKNIALSKNLYLKNAIKALNKRRKNKKLVTSLKIRRKYINNENNVVLKSKTTNRYIGNRKIGRIRKRDRFIKFRRFMRRRKKFDARVSVIEHEGQLVRCITKVGNRKIYRPLKRKFPKWWKLSHVHNQQRKKRSRDKKIAGFRWLYRSRNAIEARMLRRRKLYARYKRTGDFVAWKLNEPKANTIKKHVVKQNDYNNAFNSLISFNKIGSGIRRSQRLSMSANVGRYNKLQVIGKQELINGNISSYSNRVNNNNFGIQVLRYSLSKRYRNRKIKNSLLNSTVNLLQNRKSLFEQNIEKRKVGSLMSKNRVNVFNNSRYAMFLTKGRLNK